MSRPEKQLLPEQVAEVETLAAVLTTAQMADYFGIGRTTFFAILERDPDVAERYKRGKARAIGAIAQSLISKARGGDTTSMIFYLKTQAGTDRGLCRAAVGTGDGSCGRGQTPRTAAVPRG